MIREIACVMMAAALAACATEGGEQTTDVPAFPQQAGEPQRNPDILKGGQYMGASLQAALTEAEKHRLGSAENPVKADMPAGQHAYLSRLRCANGRAPTFSRVGNLGSGVFGSIVDAYDVRCEGSTPAQSTIIMDMYFSGHVETRAVEGFTIVR